MILHEYAILPFEIGGEQADLAQSQVKMQGWPRSDAIGTEEATAYRLPDPVKTKNELEYNVDLAFVDTSVCFLLHRSEPQPGSLDDLYELAQDILIDRNHLNKHLLLNEGDPVLAAVLENLGARDWRQSTTDYVFNFYVLELDRPPTENSEDALKIVADRSAVGVTDETSIRKIRELNSDFVEFASMDKVKNIDTDPNTIIYATWSAVVAVTCGRENVQAAKQMLVNMELRLQSLWNLCHQLNKRVTATLNNEESDPDQDGILIEMTRCLQRYQSLQLSSTASTRHVEVFSQLVSTSRLANEVVALESTLPIIERTVERRRELRQRQVNYRREMGQDWITVLLVVLTTVGSTQVISSLSSLEGWSQRWWEPVAWLVTGWLSYRWTVKRTKQERRK